jgi:hypothetical protein
MYKIMKQDKMVEVIEFSLEGEKYMNKVIEAIELSSDSEVGEPLKSPAPIKCLSNESHLVSRSTSENISKVMEAEENIHK